MTCPKSVRPLRLSCRGACLSLGVVFLVLVGSLTVWAQGPGATMPNYPFSNFRFNFINPGARASAMGQAFIALGDDATGSETNPAGLTALVEPQVFFEGRYVQNRFSTLARVVSFPSYRTTDAGTFSPTFASFVYPFRQWAFGVYRQELANYSAAPVQDQVDINGAWLTQNKAPVRVSPFGAEISLKAVNYGVSVGKRWGERVGVGVSLRATCLDAASREFVDAAYLEPGRAVADGGSTAIFNHLEGQAWAFSWVAGALFKPRDWLKIGLVYRSGSDHRFRMVYYENIVIVRTGESAAIVKPEFNVRVPSRFGAGVAFLATDRLTFTADVVRIRYGEMTAPFTEDLLAEFRDDYCYEDGTSVRVGFEYTFFWGRVPVSVRVGGYLDPDNTLHYVGDPRHNDGILVGTVFIPMDRLVHNFPLVQKSLFPEPGGDFHKTFGFGLTLKNHLQVEWAVDLARERNNAVLSLLYNF